MRFYTLRRSVCLFNALQRNLGRGSVRVRSRGLPRNRGMERICGIMTMVIRRLLVVGGAGERPVKATSPVLCFLFPIAPRYGELLPASPMSAQQKSTRRPLRCAGDCPRALSVSDSTVRLGQGRRECGRAMRQQDNRAEAAAYISTRLLSTIFLWTQIARDASHRKDIFLLEDRAE